MSSSLINSVKQKIIEASLKLLWIMLKIQGYDIYNIYKLKDEDKLIVLSKTDKIYSNRKLNLSNDDISMRRIKRWNLIITVWFCYASLKFIAIYVFSSLVSSFDESGTSDESNSSKRMVAMRILYWLGHFTRDLEWAEFISFVDHNLTCFYLIIVMRHFYSLILPIDVAQIRFLFAPKREVERIILLTKNIFTSLKMSAKAYEEQLLSKRGLTWNRACSLTFGGVRLLRRSILIYQMRINRYKATMDEDKVRRKFLLDVYSENRMLSMKVTVSKLFLYLLGIHLFFIVSALSFQHKPKKNCETEKVIQFNNFDLLTICEISIFMILFHLTSVLNNTLNGTISASQLRIADELRRLLGECLVKLVEANEQKSRRIILQANNRVLKTIVKLKLLYGEYARSTKFLNVLVVVEAIDTFRSIMILMLSVFSDYANSGREKILIGIMMSLTYKNFFAIWMASAYIKLVENEKLLWKILQQLIIMERNHIELSAQYWGSGSGRSRRGLDFLLLIWQKITYSASRDRQRYLIAPFGFKFTLKSILNADFWILNLYSWFRNFLQLQPNLTSVVQNCSK